MGLFSSSTATRDRKAQREREEADAIAATAAHEIGHAIGCAAAGIEVRYVRLTDRGGHCSHAAPDEQDQAQMDGALVMTLAGWAASAEWVYHHHNFSRTAALSWARKGSRSDWAEFRRTRRHGSHGAGWYERQAQKLVHAKWSRIERDARELVRTGYLPGSRFN